MSPVGKGIAFIVRKRIMNVFVVNNSFQASKYNIALVLFTMKDMEIGGLEDIEFTNVKNCTQKLKVLIVYCDQN